MKQASLDEVKVEIDAHNEADHKTFREGFRVIELLVKVSNFMKLEGNQLEKIRLAKLVLSNPTLQGGTLRYSYEKPFDVLLDLTSNEIWWRRRPQNHSAYLRPIFSYCRKSGCVMQARKKMRHV